MSYVVDGYQRETAASAPRSERAAFIQRTYLHLAGAVVAFIAIVVGLVATGTAEQIIKDVFLANKWAPLALMVMFIAGGYLAQYMARPGQSVGVQYAGLALYVAIEVLIFLPILTLASLPKYGGTPALPLQAGLVTLMVFAGLTAAVFLSGKDFSFMGPFLWVASFLALGVVLAGALFGFSLGLVFCGAMVALAAGFIIYDTSNVIHRYGVNEHVAASLSLFASVALLFYYILRIFMATRND